jgi:hypothetical protein
MHNAVVFTGLPRMPERFKRSITEMQELKRRGLIDYLLFVTWCGRLEGKSKFNEILNDAEVEVIEKEESPIGGVGSVWHQMRALDYGLRALPSDCRVLKTRSDTHIEQPFLEQLLSGDIEYIHTPAGSDVFRERIWTPFANIRDPFYIGDYCFYGHKNDMERLVHYDIRYHILFDLPRGGTPEERRFIHPYLLDYPFLESYMKYDRSGEYVDRRALLESRLNSPVYSAFYSFYFKCILEDFYVEYDPVTFNNVDRLSGKIVDHDHEFKTNFFPGLEEESPGRYCYYMDWIESQFGDPPDESVPQHVVEGIERSVDEWQEYEIHREALLADIKRDKQYFDYTPYPNHPVTNWLSSRVLEPLRLKEPARRLFRTVSSGD